MTRAQQKQRAPNPSLTGDEEDKLYQHLFSKYWIDYPAGRAGLKHLDLIFKQPKSYRPQCSLIVGETAAGKTTLVKKFMYRTNRDSKSNDESRCMPVVYVQSPPKADAAALYTNILRNVGAPYRATWQLARKQDQVLCMLTNLGTRMLIVDELHSMLAGHFNDRGVYMNVLKFLSNELQIPLVGVGTKEVNRAIQTDQQFGNRFEPYAIEAFKPDKDYVRFMMQICRHAKFTDFGLINKMQFVRRVHAMTKGLTGETWKLVSRLIYYAETEGNGKLTMDTLDRIVWTMPTLRRREAS